MEIIVQDIPETGKTIEAHHPQDAWLTHMMQQVMLESFEKNDSANISLVINRLGQNVDLSGSFFYSIHPLCDRCLKPFHHEEKLSIHTYLAPLYDHPYRDEEEVELVKDDLEFSYYEGDRFDLDDLLREQLELAIPMKWVCSEQCKGLCQRCGKDLNEGDCECQLPSKG